MKFTTLLLTFFLAATYAFSQEPAAPAKVHAGVDVVRNYEGTLKGQSEKVSLEIKGEASKLHGRLLVGEESYEVLQGSVTEKTLALVFNGGKLDAVLEGDMLTGDLWMGQDKRAIVLKRVAPAVAATPAVATAPAFNLNGQWEAVADANGQPVPFLLTLKVEGETVTGQSTSNLGEALVKDGLWKDGKLSFVLAAPSGDIAMAATVVEGKLTGEFDFSGQLQGKWVAVKKN